MNIITSNVQTMSSREIVHIDDLLDYADALERGEL